MKVHVLQGFKFKNTNKHKNQLVLLDKTKRQLPLLLIRYKISQTVRCSSHSNGFQNMPIIALRRQCKWYLKHFFQMSSNFFVFWQIPTCDHLNETFLAAPSFRDCFCYCCFGISAVVVYCFIGSYWPSTTNCSSVKFGWPMELKHRRNWLRLMDPWRRGSKSWKYSSTWCKNIKKELRIID